MSSVKKWCDFGWLVGDLLGIWLVWGWFGWFVGGLWVVCLVFGSLDGLLAVWLVWGWFRVLQLTFCYPIWDYFFYITNFYFILVSNILQYLTTCHKGLEVFLELIDNHCVVNVIHQDILDQLREYILLNYFHWLNLRQIYQHF